MRVQFAAMLFVSLLAYGNSQMFPSFMDSLTPKMKQLPSIKKMIPIIPQSKSATPAPGATAEPLAPISVKMVALSDMICASVLPGLPTPAMCATATTEATTVATSPAAATTPLPAPGPPSPAVAPPSPAVAPPSLAVAPPSLMAAPRSPLAAPPSPVVAPPAAAPAPAKPAP